MEVPLWPRYQVSESDGGEGDEGEVHGVYEGPPLPLHVDDGAEHQVGQHQHQRQHDRDQHLIRGRRGGGVKWGLQQNIDISDLPNFFCKQKNYDFFPKPTIISQIITPFFFRTDLALPTIFLTSSVGIYSSSPTSSSLSVSGSCNSDFLRRMRHHLARHRHHPTYSNFSWGFFFLLV